jgi:uncharacterized protein (DUF2252 family)
MLASPFSFYRGAASIMASDLQSTPATGIETQIGGDAHLLNFGAFGTPERRFVFDINDFDETTRGAWEWDLKRLVASVEIAARALRLRRREARDAALACAAAYREHMHAFAAQSVLDVWYARIDENVVAGLVGSADVRRRAGAGAPRDGSEGDAHFGPSIERGPGNTFVIADRVPRVFHPPDRADYEGAIRSLFHAYAGSLAPERRRLFERYRFVDAAYKVVGVGSVGTRCSAALFVAGPVDFLWLQVKEARDSVFARYTGHREPASHGERVVVGQRLMQSSSDLFLGWGRDDAGRSFYVRQLHDMKTSPNVDAMTAGDLRRYAATCGWALARAHARSGGDAAAIAAYLGSGTTFDRALAAFADAYADQNERDFDALRAAHAVGRIVASERGAFAPPPISAPGA